jgi:hypothetical protein
MDIPQDAIKAKALFWYPLNGTVGDPALTYLVSADVVLDAIRPKRIEKYVLKWFSMSYLIVSTADMQVLHSLLN